MSHNERFQRRRRAVVGRVEPVGCSRVFSVVQRPAGFVPAVPLNRRAISGARTPHGLSSENRKMESGARRPRGLAPLIGARDNIGPPGGALSNTGIRDQQITYRSESGNVPVQAAPICSMKLTSLPAVAT